MYQRRKRKHDINHKTITIFHQMVFGQTEQYAGGDDALSEQKAYDDPYLFPLRLRPSIGVLQQSR